MIPNVWIEEAAQRIKDLIVSTPVIYDSALDLYLKLENHQKTGSFKLRGASNKVLSLTDWELAEGVVTCSAGNHGQGVALASRLRGTQCTVFASEHAAQVKIDAMKKLGAKVILINGGMLKLRSPQSSIHPKQRRRSFRHTTMHRSSRGRARLLLRFSRNLTLLIQSVTPDPYWRRWFDQRLWAVIDERNDRPRLIGVQSDASAFAHQLLLTGSQAGVVERESIAEGLAGEIAHDSITIPLMKKYVDEVVLVSEVEIRAAIRYAWKTYGEMIEGSAAVGLAARLAGKIKLLPALTVITGGNIQPELFNSIIMDV